MKHYATVEDKWAAKTRPVEGGHLVWTGGLSGDTPVLDLRRKRYQAARVAFRILNGREPEGAVRVTCDVDHCVAPEHITDTKTRQSNRIFRRALDGLDAPSETCPNGHDRSIHGRYRGNGRPYCNRCNQALSHRNRRPAGTLRNRKKAPASTAA